MSRFLTGLQFALLSVKVSDWFAIARLSVKVSDWFAIARLSVKVSDWFAVARACLSRFISIQFKKTLIMPQEAILLWS